MIHVLSLKIRRLLEIEIRDVLTIEISNVAKNNAVHSLPLTQSALP